MINFEHISHLILMFRNIEREIACWEVLQPNLLIVQSYNLKFLNYFSMKSFTSWEIWTFLYLYIAVLHFL